MPKPPANYVLSADRGKVRLLIADTDAQAYVFTDDEIDTFLELAPSSVFVAAALAAETWARSMGRVSAKLRASDGTTSERRTIPELLALAKNLRDAALSGCLVTDTISVTSPGDLLDSYRPEWQDVNGLPAVE